MPQANPHIAIDRLAKLRQQIAALEARAASAEAAILTLPDGLHGGVATAARIETHPSGARDIHLLARDVGEAAARAAFSPNAPGADTGDDPMQMG